MKQIIFSKDILRFKIRFSNYLKEEVQINGEPMVRELIYRFAMVQFRDVNEFEPGRIHFIPKILSEMQKDFGILFEEFASFCFERGADQKFVDGTVREWLKDIMSEIIHQNHS